MLALDVEYLIDYYSEGVEQAILALPDTLAARYVVLARRMVAVGPSLGEPHTKSMMDGLLELRPRVPKVLRGFSTARWWAGAS